MPNCIVLLGMTSLFIWLREEVTTPWVRRHHDLVLVGFGLLFMLFLFGEAWSNAHLSTMLIGNHWTYLNLEIIALFNFSLLNRSPWQLFFSLLITTLWLVLNTPVYSVKLLIQFFLLVIVEVLIWRWNDQIIQHWYTYVAAFVIVVTLAFIITNAVYRHQDLAAWVRQISALLILAGACAVYGATLLKRAAQNRKFAHQAIYDELTNLRNFGAFTHDLESVYQSYVSNAEEYALFTLDIDRFKHINDTYGHLAGNLVLQQVASCLHEFSCQLVYPTHVYRTGGEEFTLIVSHPTADLASATQIAQAIQKHVGRLRFDFDSTLTIQVSIGEEQVLASDANYLDTFKRADKSLYTSKRSGRNAITVHGVRVLKTEPLTNQNGSDISPH